MHIGIARIGEPALRKLARGQAATIKEVEGGHISHFHFREKRHLTRFHKAMREGKGMRVHPDDVSDVKIEEQRPEEIGGKITFHSILHSINHFFKTPTGRVVGRFAKKALPGLVSAGTTALTGDPMAGMASGQMLQSSMGSGMGYGLGEGMGYVQGGSFKSFARKAGRALKPVVSAAAKKLRESAPEIKKALNPIISHVTKRATHKAAEHIAKEVGKYDGHLGSLASDLTHQAGAAAEHGFVGTGLNPDYGIGGNRIPSWNTMSSSERMSYVRSHRRKK